MYNGLLHTHNFMRWVVLVLAVYAGVRYLIGWLQKKNFTRRDDSAGLMFIAAMHTQLVIGLALYFFFSPFTKMFFEAEGAMGDRVLRFWGVEHILSMVIAVVFAQMGRTLSKRSQVHQVKFKRGAIFYLLALLVMLAMIPWPFMAEGIRRPWFPGMGL
jgi:hypothetical protein